MVLDITADLGAVDFAPKTELEEIIQNVRTILTTLKRTVPMDREFGIDGDIVDLPVPAAQARMTSEIVSAVSKYEPRAQVVSVDYESTADDGMDGVIKPKVKVKIDGTKESA